ncbi:hypothetical protein C6Q28_10690 [Burkholderia multivorans]|uniref:Bacteriophage protein n=1 Tax=Burkholderia multivorans (strain ATCC 17616 / 249) TaxID=395019 RepID=A0A0H3KN89_BURM1|nr:gp19 [Burkholderia phage Bcep176]ABA60020.1 gp19 [Burkholderia phage Bcep176]PRF62436.1 hypothetical protein C6Q28_10690 [Burkholderia multivorans]BAG46508.1 bacteriophage protein [Burkholderia multivorans ATCC 17616]
MSCKSHATDANTRFSAGNSARSAALTANRASTTQPARSNQLEHKISRPRSNASMSPDSSALIDLAPIPATEPRVICSSVMSRHLFLLSELFPPCLYRHKRTALAIRFPSQDSIDRRLGNLETTRDRDFAQASLGLDVAEKRGGSSWHVHANILYAND